MTVRYSILLALLLLAGCGSSDEAHEVEVDEEPTDSSTAIVDTTTTQEPTGAIRVESPKPGATLSPNSFVIRGSARTFENTVLYRLVLDSIVAVASGFTTADAPDVGKFGPFSVKVEFTSDFSGTGVLEVFEESAENGEEINKVRIPVTITAPAIKKTKRVFVYFPNTKMGSLRDCELVYPLSRELPEESKSLIRGAIYHLLKGLTEEEDEEGYHDIIPAGLRLNRASLEEGVARLDFSRQMNQLKRSCDAEMLRAQIEQTLAQFQTVNAIVITSNGKPWTMGM